MMKKKHLHLKSGVLEKKELKSEDEKIDEIDLEAIIKSKMVDKRTINPHSQTEDFEKNRKKNKNHDPLQE